MQAQQPTGRHDGKEPGINIVTQPYEEDWKQNVLDYFPCEKYHDKGWTIVLEELADLFPGKMGCLVF